MIDIFILTVFLYAILTINQTQSKWLIKKCMLHIIYYHNLVKIIYATPLYKSLRTNEISKDVFISKQPPLIGAIIQEDYMTIEKLIFNPKNTLISNDIGLLPIDIASALNNYLVSKISTSMQKAHLIKEVMTSKLELRFSVAQHPKSEILYKTNETINKNRLSIHSY